MAYSVRPANSGHAKNSALIGMLCGDASMNAPTSLYIRHGGKQLKFVDEKVSFLRNYLKPRSVRQATDRQGYVYRYAYYNDPSLRYIHDLLYQNGRKAITERMLSRFNAVSLAFFYMDDGCLSLRKSKRHDGMWHGCYSSREIHLNVQGFTFEEASMFQRMLEVKFDLSFHMTKDHGHPRLWCNTSVTRKMLPIVIGTVSQFSSMAYKLDLKYKLRANRNISSEMVVCSELHGDMESPAEMTGPLFGSIA